MSLGHDWSQRCENVQLHLVGSLVHTDGQEFVLGTNRLDGHLFGLLGKEVALLEVNNLLLEDIELQIVVILGRGQQVEEEEVEDGEANDENGHQFDDGSHVLVFSIQ